MSILKAYKDDNEEVTWVEDGTELQIQYASDPLYLSLIHI